MSIVNNRSRWLWISVLCLLVLCSGGLIYHYWYQLITLAQGWQRYFHQETSTLLINVQTAPLRTGVVLIIISFLYGMLHSAGPGHGKIIITTYLITQPKLLKKSLLLTILSALMQGVVAILLISVLLLVLRLSTHYLTLSEYWLELISYLLIMVVGVLVGYRATKKIVSLLWSTKKPTVRINQLEPLPHQQPLIHSQHRSCHCCAHHHLADQQAIKQSRNWLDDLAIILAIGIRPCSGALLVLIFSFTIGSYTWGVMATIAMAIGTATTTSLLALLVHSARRLAESLLKGQPSSWYPTLAIIIQFLALAGGLLLIIMGLILMIGASQPLAPTGNPLLIK